MAVAERSRRETFGGSHYPLWVLWCLSIAGLSLCNALGHGQSIIGMAILTVMVIASVLLLAAWWKERRSDS
jgi:O-antigen/teichoic acid export membrane protein